MPMPIAIPGPAWFRFAAATARWITIAHRMAPRAVGKATMKPSPWVLTTAPPNALIRLRTIAPCSRTIREASSSPNSSVCSVYRRTARTLRVRSGDCFLRPARSRSSPAALQGGTKNSSRCTGEMERLSNRLPSLSPNDAARLQLVARQAAKRHRRHLEPDAEARPQRLLQSRRARRVPDLDQHADLVKLPRPEDLDLELIDRRETPHDPLDRGREHVDATDDEHVVEAPEDAALQAAEGATARTGRLGQTHVVARAIPDDRRAHTPKIRQDELAVTGGRGRCRVDHLDDELRFVDVESSLLGALVAVGAHLGHTAMVEGARAPAVLDPGAHRRDPGPRLAGVQGDPHRQLREVDAALPRDLREVKGVGRRAHEHRRAEGLHPGQPRRRVLATAGNRQCAERQSPLEARPEPDEEAERKREEDAVGRPDARAPQHEPPAACPPLP